MPKIKKIILWARKKPVRMLHKRRNYRKLKQAIEIHEPIIGRYPLNVQIQTTSLCNGKCRFCGYLGSWNQKNPGRMSWEIYEKIIQNLKKFRIGKFYPYGANEPLLDKGIFHKIRYAVENLDPECVELSTNLSILNRGTLDEIKKLFPRIKHKIVVSFHGISQDSYQDQMGLDYHVSLKNVLSLVELSQEAPLKIMIHGTSGARRSFSKLKVWFGADEYFNFWEGKLSSFEIKPEISYFDYNNLAGMPQLRNQGEFYNKIFRSKLKKFYCSWFDRYIFINHTGEPLLCCMDYIKETGFGEGIEEKSIEELYSSPRYMQMIRKGIGLIDSEKDFICKRCSDPFEQE